MSDYEDRVRAGFGYSPVESRSEAERASAAARMLAKAESHSDVVLPEDIEVVWGKLVDETGQSAANTARYLIGEWGIDRFRKSAIHQLALIEETHKAGKKGAQDDFRKRDLKAIAGGKNEP